MGFEQSDQVHQRFEELQGEDECLSTHTHMYGIIFVESNSFLWILLLTILDCLFREII